jgi:hypothetical protein
MGTKAKEYDHFIKLMLIGDSGKSTLVATMNLFFGLKLFRRGWKKFSTFEIHG